VVPDYVLRLGQAVPRRVDRVNATLRDFVVSSAAASRAWAPPRLSRPRASPAPSACAGFTPGPDGEGDRSLSPSGSEP
jgi:hypothetical protein